MARAVKYDITIEQRATFTQVFTYLDANGAPIDLTSSSARMQVRRQGSGALILELTSGNGGILLGGTDGTLTLTASAVTTAGLPTGNFVYSVEVITGSTITRLIDGKCAIKAGVTVVADPAPDTTAPSVPTLTATVDSSSQVTLNWTAAFDPVVTGQVRSGLAGYRIYQDSVLIDTILPLTTYVVSGLTPATAYSFNVIAFDVAGNASDPSTTATVTTETVDPVDAPDTTPPTVPADLIAATASITEINLTWTASTDPLISFQIQSGLAGYNVYRGGVLIDTLGLVTTYAATGLSPSTLYSFRVSAFDLAGNESAQCPAQTATTADVPDGPDVTAPSVPTGLTPTVLGTTRIDLVWAASSDPTITGEVRSGLAGYKVYKDGSLLATLGTVTVYSAVGLSPSTLYSFRVSALDNAGNESAQCAAQTATTSTPALNPDTTPPSVPTGLALAVAGTTRIDLSWTASTDPLVGGDTQSGLAGYKVYKDGTLLATLGAVTTYSATGLSPSTTYSFRVSAFDAATNESAQCTAVTAGTSANPDTTAPTVPTGLALGVVSTSRIDLAWAASTDPTVAGALHSGLAGYKVYKNGVLLTTLGLVTTYSAIGLTAATSYTFRVSAIDAAGNESAQSTAQSATTSANPDTTAPSVPTGLTATAVSTTGINLIWVASTDPTVAGQTKSGLAGYKVYKDSVLLATLGLVTSYSATGLTPSTLYSFRVSAIDVATNESAQSTAATATTLAVTLPDTTAPTVPTGLALAVISASQINLSWVASIDPIVPGQTTGGVAGYKVYKDGLLLATLGLVTTYSATGLTAGTLYSFKVSAFDVATNESAQSAAVTATTNSNPDVTAPSVPTGLALTVVSTTRIDLAWSASTDPTVTGEVRSGLAGYKVYRNGVFLITLGLVTTYSATGLTSGVAYTFRVSAIDVAGNESAQGAAQIATTIAPDTAAPTVPAGLTPIVISSAAIDLSWSASTDPVVAGRTTSGVAGYKVYRGGVLIATLGLVTAYSVTGLTASTTYSFTVASFDVAGNNSAQSAPQTATTSSSTTPDTTAPSVPSALTLSVISSSQINLSWTASVDPLVSGQVQSGLVGYKIYRNAILFATVGLVTSYGATGLTPSTLYAFRVSAIDAAGNESAQSTQQTATTSAPPSGGTALADWQARSTAPGVVWANRFSTPTDPGLFWGQGPTNFINGKRVGYVGPGRTVVGVEGMTRYAEGVIPGTGCLEQYTPANVIIGGSVWARPYAPTTGAMAVPAQAVGGGFTCDAYTPDTTGPEMDINNAGWPRFDYKNAPSNYIGDGYNKMHNLGGGLICNPADLAAYQRTIPAVVGRHPAYQEITAAPADGFYVQYRIKFPVFPNGDCLLDYTQGSNLSLPYRGAWQGKSWLTWSFGTSNYFREIGSLLWGYSPDATTGFKFSFAPIMYGHRADWLYANGPQVNTTGSQIEGSYSTSCSYLAPATCWKPTRNRWITFLVHIIPGSQNVSDQGDINKWLRGDFGPLTRNQSVEMWVADEGAANYTKLLTATGYAIFYSGRYALNGQTKTNFGFGDQYYGTSNLGGDLLITPETNAQGYFNGCEIEFQQGAIGSLPGGVGNSTKLYTVMVGTTAFKLATSRANALASTPVVLPYVNGGTDVAPNRNRVGFSAGPGYSFFQVLQQMNQTSANSPYEKPSWILYDQIICSTQFIPCPAVV